jgi:ATPase subunit of ABC transporter with duplicated ATPase domains
MGSLEAHRIRYALPGGRTLLDDASFRVGDGEHVALVGANGTGKTTLLRLLVGDLDPAAGSVAIDGRALLLPQLVGDDDRTVRELMLSLSPRPVRAAAVELTEAEVAAEADPGDSTGMRLARAHATWADAGGYEAEVLWDVCSTAALGMGFDAVASRRRSTLSGGEQKRLALELLLRSDADVLLLDEPDNFLDVPGKEWLEDQLVACPKTILFVSHDRELLAKVAAKIVTIEGRGAWTHGGTFARYHDARDARLARLDDEHKQFMEERKRLTASLNEFRRRASMGSDTFASRVRATKHRIERFDREPPPERPATQTVSMRLGGDRTGKRVVMIEQLALSGLTDPFDTEIWFGERVGIVGRNGTGKSHFLRLLAGHEIEHTGRLALGARVVTGYFSQVHDRPDLVDRSVLATLLGAGKARGEAMATLRRYELHGCADQPFATLSGGQQARLQILLLELSGATLLLLDEPTDNLDLVSSEALEAALDQYEGTVIAVTHDRWLMRSFDRFLVFGSDCTVSESPEPLYR